MSLDDGIQPAIERLKKMERFPPCLALNGVKGSEVTEWEGMPSVYQGSVINSFQRLFDAGTVMALTDTQLLERFVTAGDEAAFEAILQRHGPMVLRVCRRVLDDPHDVDDAFQATFLILVKKARAIRDRDVLAYVALRGRPARGSRAGLNARRRRDCERTAGVEGGGRGGPRRRTV